MKKERKQEEKALDKAKVVCDMRCRILNERKAKTEERKKKANPWEGKKVANHKATKQKTKGTANGSWLPPHLKPYVRSAAELRAETKHMKTSLSEEIIAQRKGR